jgi:hypothetical protein
MRLWGFRTRTRIALTNDIRQRGFSWRSKGGIRWQNRHAEPIHATAGRRYLSGPESLIHLIKIVNNTTPTAAQAAPRTSQKTRAVNWYLVSLSFMAGAKLEVMALFRQSRR